MELETWVEANPEIDFSTLEPASTSRSLHIYEERYEVDGETYRLLYAIGDKSNVPTIEKLAKKEMSKYRVKSGDLDMEVKAENRTLAAMDAIRLGKPKSLGILLGIRKKGEKKTEEVFMLTQKILEDMGQKVMTPEQAERYKKKVDPKNYMEIKVNVKDRKPKHYLTEEEFRAGKQGYVWLDRITGKLSFAEKNKEG